MDANEIGSDIRLHMAEHLRNLALASLPWHVLASGSSEKDSRSAIAGARSKAENSSIARMEDDIEEVTLSFDDHDDSDVPPGEWDKDLSKVKRIPGLEEEERNEMIADWTRRVKSPITTLPAPQSQKGSFRRLPLLTDRESAEDVKPKRTFSSTISTLLKPFRPRRKPGLESFQPADHGIPAEATPTTAVSPYPAAILDEAVNPFDAEFAAATKRRRGQ
jgi:hypothetical protein